jgi:hypothetical protein
MNATLKTTILCLIVVTGMLLAQTARADIHPGFRVGGYFDAGAAFVGGEIVADVGYDWHFVPNAELIFVDNGTEATFNFDFQYDLHTNYGVDMWAGAGPAIVYFNPDNPNRRNDTDFGVNLLFGVGFPIRNAHFMPYIQPKVLLSDNSDFVLAFGVRF